MRAAETVRGRKLAPIMPERLHKILITDEEHQMPYSKGLMASSIMATGLPPDKAYNIATTIQERLRDEGSPEVTMHHVREVAETIMEREVGSEYVSIYRKWRALAKLNRPIIILIGGATGVGKSTIATMMASRLGITRQVSTDVIREVMRSSLAPSLVPTLYTSSFKAFESLQLPLPDETDKVILGFLEQAAAVWVGVKGLIERAVTERTNFIIEGAHVVPGIIESKVFGDAIVVQMVIAVEDEYQHRCHFEMREVETEGTRTLERYLENFDSIRRIQEYILGLAEKEKVKVFSSYNIDATVGSIIQYVIDEIFGGRHDFELERETPGERARAAASGAEPQGGRS